MSNGESSGSRTRSATLHKGKVPYPARRGKIKVETLFFRDRRIFFIQLPLTLIRKLLRKF